MLLLSSSHRVISLLTVFFPVPCRREARQSEGFSYRATDNVVFRESPPLVLSCWHLWVWADSGNVSAYVCVCVCVSECVKEGECVVMCSSIDQGITILPFWDLWVWGEEVCVRVCACVYVPVVSRETFQRYGLSVGVKRAEKACVSMHKCVCLMFVTACVCVCVSLPVHFKLPTIFFPTLMHLTSLFFFCYLFQHRRCVCVNTTLPPLSPAVLYNEANFQHELIPSNVSAEFWHSRAPASQLDWHLMYKECLCVLTFPPQALQLEVVLCFCCRARVALLSSNLLSTEICLSVSPNPELPSGTSMITIVTQVEPRSVRITAGFFIFFFSAEWLYTGPAGWHHSWKLLQNLVLNINWSNYTTSYNGKWRRGMETAWQGDAEQPDLPLQRSQLPYKTPPPPLPATVITTSPDWSRTGETLQDFITVT